MQDGQAAGGYHPDRQEHDREDVEYVAPTDSETEARTASLDAGYKDKGGMYDSSLERFMDEWSDGDSVSKPGSPDANVHPEAQEMNKRRRCRSDASSYAAATAQDAPTAAGSSKGQPSKGTRKKPPSGKALAKKQPAAPIPKGVVLNVAPLRSRRPALAPQVDG